MLRWLDRLLQVVAGAVVATLLLVVAAGVLTRALNQPLSWTDEASGYLMAWLACLGWMLATRQGAHIRIRVLLDRLPPPLSRATEAIILLAVALLGGIVAWQGVALVQRNADIESLALPISAAWLYIPLLPAGALTTLQALAELWRVLTRDEGPALEPMP